MTALRITVGYLPDIHSPQRQGLTQRLPGSNEDQDHLCVLLRLVSSHGYFDQRRHTPEVDGTSHVCQKLRSKWSADYHFGISLTVISYHSDEDGAVVKEPSLCSSPLRHKTNYKTNVR